MIYEQYNKIPKGSIAGCFPRGHIYPFCLLVSQEKQNDLWGILLVVIASDYIGFGIMDGRMKQKLIEIAICTGFVVLSVLGLWYSAWFLVIGYVGHGIWDYIHDHRLVVTKIKRWYPPFCMIYDWLIGAWLLYTVIR